MDVVSIFAGLSIFALTTALIALVVRHVRVLRACREAEDDGTQFDWWAWAWPLLLWTPIMIGGIILLVMLITRRSGAGVGFPERPASARPGFAERGGNLAARIGQMAKNVPGQIKEMAGGLKERMAGLKPSVPQVQIQKPSDMGSVMLALSTLTFIVAAAVLGALNKDGATQSWLILSAVAAAASTIGMYVRCRPAACAASAERRACGLPSIPVQMQGKRTLWDEMWNPADESSPGRDFQDLMGMP